MKDKVKVEDLRIGQVVFCVKEESIYLIKIKDINSRGSSYSVSGTGGYCSVNDIFTNKEDAMESYLSNVNKKVISDLKDLEERIELLKSCDE